MDSYWDGQYLRIRSKDALSFPCTCLKCGEATRKRLRLTVSFVEEKRTAGEVALGIMVPVPLPGMKPAEPYRTVRIPMCSTCSRPIRAVGAVGLGAVVAIVVFLGWLGFFHLALPDDIVMIIAMAGLIVGGLGLAVAHIIVRNKTVPFAIERASGIYTYIFTGGIYHQGAMARAAEDHE